MFERDTDDPERAKKLVGGLEDVPVGLIRRLERVGKASVADESENPIGGGLGDGGCAICWERLLFETDENEDSGKEKGEGMADQPSNAEDMDTSSVQTEFDSLSSSSQVDEPQSSTDTGRQYQRIVSLPCAHVFHAQCLVPWFSKPKQTTCPICRFNIDPENLTYTSRAQRRNATRAQTRTQEQQREGDNGNATGPRQDAGEGDDVDADAGADGVGIDIPLMFGGAPPSTHLLHNLLTIRY
jgi:collagen type II alpha/collagen type III alpha